MPEIILHSPSKNYPSRVVRGAERLLASIEPSLLIGLGKIVLTNVADLPAKQKRRHQTKRGLNRGCYRRARGGRRASIEIYLDGVGESFLPGVFRWPVVCDFAIGETLFHEVGHHINLHVKREHKDAELAADEWKDRLMRSFLRDLWCFRGPCRRWLAKRIFGFLKRVTSRKARAV